jgi:hypothetical protein
MQPFFISPTESLLIGLCLGGYSETHHAEAAAAVISEGYAQSAGRVGLCANGRDVGVVVSVTKADDGEEVWFLTDALLGVFQ